MGWSKKGSFEREDVEETKLLIESYLDKMPIEKYQICGSYRRGKKTVGDLDFLILSSEYDLRSLVKELNDHGIVDEILTSGTVKSSVVVNNIQIDFIFITELKKWGAALLHNTGPKFSNIKIRRKANELGYKLNEYCLTNIETDSKLYFDNEEMIYDKLELVYVEPEKRK